MIALIKGAVYTKTAEYIIIEANGIGYRIFLPSTAINTIHVGDFKEIFTYLHVREDAMLLYGFLKETEKEIFIKLLGISGLGPKTALAVISNVSIDSFLKAVEQSDSDTFAKVPGIGKKTAQRIILELKGKISFEDATSDGEDSNENASVASEALLGLGYTKADIKKALSSIDTNSYSPEGIIRQALKLLAKV